MALKQNECQCAWTSFNFRFAIAAFSIASRCNSLLFGDEPSGPLKRLQTVTNCTHTGEQEGKTQRDFEVGAGEGNRTLIPAFAVDIATKEPMTIADLLNRSENQPVTVGCH